MSAMDGREEDDRRVRRRIVLVTGLVLLASLVAVALLLAFPLGP